MASDVVNTTRASSLAAFGASHVGRVRAKNEDAFFCDTQHGLFGVIDGMGGHAAGEHAARIACDVIVSSVKDSRADAEIRIREAVTNANNEICQQALQHSNWNSMACVLTVALVTRSRITIGHVGDTRIYRLRRGQIERLTRDHSLIGDLEEKCLVTELEAMQHPRRNEVLRDVGTELWNPSDESFVDIYQFEIEDGDAFLLCSDGLSDMLTSRQIFELTQYGYGRPQEVVHDLIRAANSAGGKDNITAVYVTVRENVIQGINLDETEKTISHRVSTRTEMATIYKRAGDKGNRRARFAWVFSRWGEFVGLVLASSVVIFGIALVYQAKTRNREKTSFHEVDQKLRAGELINLNKVNPAELTSALTAFDDLGDRKFVADRISDYVTRNKRSLESVGSLTRITVDRGEIDQDPNLVLFKERLARVRADEGVKQPGRPEPPVRLLGEFAQFKQLFIVRTPSEFNSELSLWTGLFILIFFVIHIIWRGRSFKGDQTLLPIVLLLAGLGLILMITLRDPLRDSLSFKDFSVGVLMGGAALCAASLTNFQRLTSKLVLLPLILATLLSVLLLAFGTGPGESDAKVNLWFFQPGEFIKILLVFFLAAYFAQNWEYLREHRQKGGGLLALLRRWKAPRLAEIVPVSIAMVVSLGFFFLQKDLGPALIMGLTFVTLYAVARHRSKAALFGLTILGLGIWIGYKFATPLTVYRRIRIWLDVWDNGLRNGDQIAHAWWGVAMGRYSGTGLGLGSPSLIPAGHTDLVLASLGEELGLIGLAIIILLYVLICVKGFGIALRSQSDYGLFLSLGLTLILILQTLLITSGMLGLFPLSGVVSPFLSWGKSSMIANCAIIGVLLSLSAKSQHKREHRIRFGRPIKIISLVLGGLTFLIIARAAHVQVWKSDENAISPVLTKQRDNQYRYVYNPRLADALKLLPHGTIYDRNGIPLATSNWAELESHRRDYESLGIDFETVCKKEDTRCYPFGPSLFHLLGDARTKENWSASNSAYLERDYAARLRGFTDRIERIRRDIVEIDHVTKQISSREVEVVRHDYTDLLPLLRYRNRPSQSDYQELIQRERHLKTSIDAALQLKASDALRQQLTTQNLQRGAAVFMDSATGEVLAMVSLPLPTPTLKPAPATDANDLEQAESLRDQFLNRAFFGLYPPGSTFKIVTAVAALRKDPSLAAVTHECKVLGDGRVGNYIKGWGRPIRDAEGDRVHGSINMEDGIVDSCNAFFGQFATYNVGAVELWRTANLFEIPVAKPNSAQLLNDSLPWSAFGQGQVLASPFQMARVAATISDGGVMPYGKWVIDDSNQRVGRSEAILNRPESGIIARAMRGVVQRGTAANLRTIAPPISGKTGTAEVENMNPHSWFIGFVSVGNGKQVAFAVIVENGGFGNASAAPVAGEIVKALTAY